MVSNHNNVTKDNIFGSLMYPEVIPIVIIKKENSLICHKDIPVKKLFFLVCHKNHNIIIVMIGFIINTKTVKINNGINILIVVDEKLT
jgi:hypothetical protein